MSTENPNVVTREAETDLEKKMKKTEAEINEEAEKVDQICQELIAKGDSAGEKIRELLEVIFKKITSLSQDAQVRKSEDPEHRAF